MTANQTQMVANKMKTLLSTLRELPTMIRAPSAEELERDGHPFSMLECVGAGKLPKTGLVEFSGAVGSGKTEVVLKFLAENPGLRVGWVEENLTIYPCALPQRQVGLDRVLFVDAKEGSSEALWTAQQILRSQIFGVLVLNAHGCDLTALRRLQLAAERSKALVVLLSETPSVGNVWPISVQIHVERVAGEPMLEVLRNKFGGVGYVGGRALDRAWADGASEPIATLSTADFETTLTSKVRGAEGPNFGHESSSALQLRAPLRLLTSESEERLSPSFDLKEFLHPDLLAPPVRGTAAMHPPGRAATQPPPASATLTSKVAH